MVMGGLVSYTTTYLGTNGFGILGLGFMAVGVFWSCGFGLLSFGNGNGWVVRNFLYNKHTHTHTHIRYKQLDDDDYDDGQPNGGNSKGG